MSATDLLIKPIVIHPGKYPQNYQQNELKTLPDQIWGFNEKGWTDNELALKQLRKIFIPETQKKGKRRLLILDGHESHLSGEFQYECITAEINLIFLPPHSSYLLQPLNRGPFSPLTQYYAEAVKNYIPSSLAPIDRAIFNYYYQIIRPRVFTKQNNKAGWSRADIKSANPKRIMQEEQVQNLT